MTIASLISILKTLPQDAIVLADDGTGSFAEVLRTDLCIEDYDNENPLYLEIYASGKNV
jgi:hypothetical protein